VSNQIKTCDLTQKDYGELMACLKEIYDKLDKLRNTILNITGKFNDAHFIEIYLKACLDESGQEPKQCAQDLLTLLNSLRLMLENPPDDVLKYFDEAVTKIDAAMVLTANIMGGLRLK
jgi:hypothetical protein